MTDCTDVGIDVRQAVKLGHPVRQVVVGIIALLLAVIVWLCAVNPNFGWSTVGYYLFNPNIMTGIQMTIVLTIVAMAIGTLLGLVCALGKMCGVPFFMRLTDLFVSVVFPEHPAFSAASFLVQPRGTLSGSRNSGDLYGSDQFGDHAADGRHCRSFA